MSTYKLMYLNHSYSLDFLQYCWIKNYKGIIRNVDLLHLGWSSISYTINKDTIFLTVKNLIHPWLKLLVNINYLRKKKLLKEHAQIIWIALKLTGIILYIRGK